MVRIQVKHGGGESQAEREFLYDCQSVCHIEDIAREIVQISNLQLKVARLVVELEPRLLAFHVNPQALPEAKSYSSKDQVLYNKAISYYLLKDHVQTLEKEAKENYNLLGFENANKVQQLLTVVELFREETTQLRWAGKHLMRDKKLSDYIGTNDKTKIVLRLQPSIPYAV